MRRGTTTSGAAGGTPAMTIGALAAATETSAETIRYYERAGVLPAPARRDSGYRLYGPGDVERLRFIRRARELGFSLEQVRELVGLADVPDRSCDEIDRIARVHLGEVEAKLAQLAALRTELRRVISQCRGGHVSDCRIVDALSRPAVRG
jgi:Cu(I)-responsive transcriptional regulator